MSLFTSYRGALTSSVLMGNGSVVVPVSSWCCYGQTEAQFKLDFPLKEKHAPLINSNHISGSLLRRDGYKLVFESNKVVVSKFGNFIGKGYDSGCLFCLNTVEPNYHLNIASMCEICESNMWHSRFCHINFVTIATMSRLEFVPKFEVVKGSKCHSCVQAKQPRKPFKSLEEKGDLTLLYLIHSNLC